ncbi:hypothetical protein ACXYL9_01575 [Qipengyuania sp. CAU 1752]
MGVIGDVAPACEAAFDPHKWIGRVLEHFARAEQAICELSIELDLPVEKGPLISHKELLNRLSQAEDRRAKDLAKRLKRWLKKRPYRHLLAHATILTLFDGDGRPVTVTKQSPRTADDVAREKIWTLEEQNKLLNEANNDGRSIRDQVTNLCEDKKVMAQLRA